jgi:hypothetical protein
MKKLSLSFLGVLLCILPACAQYKTTASITVTNSTTNGVFLTLNGDTRTFTNNVLNAASQVLTNSDATGAGSKTNLLGQIRATPFTQVRSADTGSNSFNLVGNADLPMTLSLSAGYATVSYSTQLVADVIGLQGPVAGLPTAQARINVASDIVGGINDPGNTNQISQVSTAAGQLLGTTNAQMVTGQKTLSNTNNAIAGVITSIALSGNSVYLTNGLYFTPILLSPVFTNAVNYGNAFSSHGTNTGTEQYGSGATARGSSSIALGFAADAEGYGSVSIGGLSLANTIGSIALGISAQSGGTNSMALGAQANALGNSSTAVGFQTTASGDYSTAIGFQASSTYTNSTAIGGGIFNDSQ